MFSDRLYRFLKPSPSLGRIYCRAVRHLPHRQRRVKHFGQQLQIDPSELHGFYLYYEREYDDWIFEFLEKRLGEYTRALDIGANIGIYSVFLASKIDCVHAFEPDHVVLAGLRANLALNGSRNVAVHEACVADRSGSVRFVSSSRSNRGLGRISSEASGGIDVAAMSLDDFCGGPIEEPTLIKIDIEGGEWLALQGCTQSVGRRTAKVDILIELHPDAIRSFGGSLLGLKEQLNRLGLAVSAITPKGLHQPDGDEKSRFWWAVG